MSIYKDPNSTNSLFTGRNLPTFIKDFLLKRYLNIQTDEINQFAMTEFLNKIIPASQESVKDKLQTGENVMLLTRFVVYINVVKNKRQFAIPDYGIKQRKGLIPEYVYSQHQGDFIEDKKWGINQTYITTR